MNTTHKRTRLLGLFSDCPWGEELEACPAREFRKLSLPDRVKIAEGVSPEVIDRFLSLHELCLGRRQEQLGAKHRESAEG
jgi:hypothetical protein